MCKMLVVLRMRLEFLMRTASMYKARLSACEGCAGKINISLMEIRWLESDQHLTSSCNIRKFRGKLCFAAEYFPVVAFTVGTKSRSKRISFWNEESERTRRYEKFGKTRSFQSGFYDFGNLEPLTHPFRIIFFKQFCFFKIISFYGSRAFNWIPILGDSAYKKFFDTSVVAAPFWSPDNFSILSNSISKKQFFLPIFTPSPWQRVESSTS